VIVKEFVIRMGQFPIEKCEVVWQKDVSSDDDRKAIIEDLKKMAFELQEAIDFTVKLSNRKMNEIKYWLDTGTESQYTLSVYYDSHASAWGMIIEELETGTTASEVVGEIACMNPVTLRFIEEKDALRVEPLA
jgi:hypothetical protein